MRLPRFLRRLFKQPSNRKLYRDITLSKIEDLGFEVVDLSGWHQGKFAPRRYQLVDLEGKILDNDGEGFASSAEAFRAARAAAGSSRKP